MATSAITAQQRPRLVLASASPARHRLLELAGMDVEVCVSGIDEDVIAAQFPSAPPADIARELALAKARSVAANPPPAPPDAETAPLLVVGCDSVLEMPDVAELSGQALGKPGDPATASHRWRLMRGQRGLLRTGHCVISRPADGAAPWREEVDVGTTAVSFAADLSDSEIDAYVATGEPLPLAGGFAIDGRAAAFVESVHGDPANVIGLSLPLLRQMLTRLGVCWTGLWR